MDKAKYNVVLITVDSWRADYSGLYSSEIAREGISQNIDRWAQSEGCITFSRAISQSSHTSPAFLALLSGNYPSKYGDWFLPVSDKRPLMAEIFQRNGYNTYAFHSNPYISYYFRFNRGFDFFQDNMSDLYKQKFLRNHIFLLSRLKSILVEPYENAETINAQVLQQLKLAKKPFFMWIHYMDVHGPYAPNNGWAAKNRIKAAYLWKKSLKMPESISQEERNWIIQSYKKKINYLDNHLIKIIHCLDSDNTIVILTADHGDLFGEHNSYGHTLKLYNGLLHVPLIIKLPPSINITYRRVNTPVRSVDLLPTLVDLLKLEIGDDVEFAGKSYLPLFSPSNGEYENDYIISEVSRKYLCAEKDNWKLIVDYQHDSKELYHLSEDPFEQTNLIQRYPNLVETFEKVLQQHIVVNDNRTTPLKAISQDEAMKERLRALGYFD